MQKGKKGLAEVTSEVIIITVMVTIAVVFVYVVNSWGIYNKGGLEKETDINLAQIGLDVVIQHVSVSITGSDTIDEVTAWVSNVGEENALILGVCAYDASTQPCNPLSGGFTPVTCDVGCVVSVTGSCSSCSRSSVIVVRVYAVPKRVIDEYAGGDVNLYLNYGRMATRVIAPSKSLF